MIGDDHIEARVARKGLPERLRGREGEDDISRAMSRASRGTAAERRGAYQGRRGACRRGLLDPRPSLTSPVRCPAASARSARTRLHLPHPVNPRTADSLLGGRAEGR